MTIGFFYCTQFRFVTGPVRCSRVPRYAYCFCLLSQLWKSWHAYWFLSTAAEAHDDLGILIRHTRTGMRTIGRICKPILVFWIFFFMCKWWGKKTCSRCSLYFKSIDIFSVCLYCVHVFAKVTYADECFCYCMVAEAVLEMTVHVPKN